MARARANPNRSSSPTPSPSPYPNPNPSPNPNPISHQRVWSPRARAVVPLTPLPPPPPPVTTSPPGATPPGATGVASAARPAVPSPPACTATEVPLGGATSAAYPPRPPLWGPWKRAKMSAEER